eukprot:jgi/Psemu1/51923/gm1.51923_g
MMLTHNVTQSQINQNNHWDEELDRDGGNRDEEGSLAAAFDVQILGCNNSEHNTADGNNNNNNNNNELHVGMQDGYYYKDGTQVEEATTYPKPPPQDYLSAKYNRLLCKDGMSKFNFAYNFDYIMKLSFTMCINSGRRRAQTCVWMNQVFSKGGHRVILSVMDRVRPRGYLHRHQQYKKQPPHSAKGYSEVQDIFTKCVNPEIGKLWSSPPHLTADNFFNGNSILHWMGGLGFG